MGISNYDIASTLVNVVAQRLVRKICPECAKKREFTNEEKEIIKTISDRYGMNIDLSNKFTYDAVGCDKCNGSGYYDRIGVFEILEIDDELKELIVNGDSNIAIRLKALENGYKPLVVDALNKVVNGLTTLSEINKKLIIY